MIYLCSCSPTVQVPDRARLTEVNLFFNNGVRYTTDAEAWGVNEYWATPRELISRGAGDCEDFAIAKFFALVAAGVDEDDLKIVYARLTATGQDHMILVYRDSLVLDNLVDGICALGDRSDLVPILGFNRSGVWSFTHGGIAILPRSSKEIPKWRELQKRMQDKGPTHGRPLSSRSSAIDLF